MENDLFVEKHTRQLVDARHARFLLGSAYADADVFYDISNVSNALLEARIADKYIVAHNNGEIGQFIGNVENGILLEYEGLPKYPQVIKELLADEHVISQLGANACEFAEKTSGAGKSASTQR